MKSIRLWLVFAVLVTLPVLILVSPASADPKQEDAAEKYTLRYSFQPGETLRWRVVHLARIKTIPVNIINVLDILSHQALLITEPAVRRAEKLWGNGLAQGGDNASIRGAETTADN